MALEENKNNSVDFLVMGKVYNLNHKNGQVKAVFNGSYIGIRGITHEFIYRDDKDINADVSISEDHTLLKGEDISFIENVNFAFSYAYKNWNHPTFGFDGYMKLEKVLQEAEL